MSSTEMKVVDPEASICNPNEMSEFEKYLTGNSYTEQMNINDGAVVLTATFTGDDNDGNALIIDEGKSTEHKNTEEH